MFGSTVRQLMAIYQDERLQFFEWPRESRGDYCCRCLVGYSLLLSCV